MSADAAADGAAAVTGGEKQKLCKFCDGEAWAKCIKCDQPTCRDDLATHECKQTDAAEDVTCSEHSPEKISCGCSVCLQLFCALCLNKSNRCPGPITGKGNWKFDKKTQKRVEKQSKSAKRHASQSELRPNQPADETKPRGAFFGRLSEGQRYEDRRGAFRSSVPDSARSMNDLFGFASIPPVKQSAIHSFCNISILEESCKTLLADQMAIAWQTQENLTQAMDKADLKGDTAEEEGRKGLQEYKIFAQQVIQRYHQKVQDETEQIEIYLKGLRQTRDDFITQHQTRHGEIRDKIAQAQKILTKESVEQLVLQTHIFVPEIMTINEQEIAQFELKTKTVGVNETN